MDFHIENKSLTWVKDAWSWFLTFPVVTFNQIVDNIDGNSRAESYQINNKEEKRQWTYCLYVLGIYHISGFP